MRVVHISKVKGIAGSEGHLLRLLPGLIKQGVEVCMIVLEDPRYPAASFCHALEERGVPVETMPIRGHFDPLLLLRLSRKLRSLRPDLVHTHLIHADLYGLPAAKWAGVPAAVSSQHNDDAFRHHLAIKWINQWVMRYADRVIAISHAVARLMSETAVIDPVKIVTIYYGLDASPQLPTAREMARTALNYRPTDQVIGMFGRLVRQKGVDVLLDAFSQVHVRYPSARLVIVGDGPLSSQLKGQAQRLGLEGVVKFTGWMERASRLMPACDIVVVPSRWEGFGLVTLEAMGWSRPIVASRTSALPEIVLDGKTGLLVPPDDAVALAEAIEILLADSERATAMGQAGYERLVREFSVDKMVQATLDVYGQVVTRVTG
jgi:glycosyltransferase involved in cell wall biosynthesis